MSTGFESPWLFLGGLPNIPDASVLKILQPFGEVIEISRPPNTSYPMTIKVHFSRTSEAFAALKALHGRREFGSTLEARMSVEGKSNRMVYNTTAVRIDWEAPYVNAFMGYANKLLAEQAIDDSRLKPYDDFMTIATLHTGRPAVGKVTVKFCYLPAHANRDGMKIFGPHQDMVFEDGPNLNLTNPTVPDMIKGLKRMLAPFRSKMVDLDIRPPPYKEGKMRAWASFETEKDAEEVARALHNRKPPYMGSTRIVARHVRSITFSVSTLKYNKAATEIRSLQQRVWGQGGGYTLIVTDKVSFYSVKISGEDLKVLTRIKSEFEMALNGEAVHDEGKVVWDGFFSWPSGVTFLQNLRREHPGVTIEPVFLRRTIRLFGDAETRAFVRQKIIKMVRERRSRSSFIIPLNRYVANAFAEDKGAGMPVLEAALGQGNATLDLWQHQLVISGDLDAYTTACDVLNGFRQKHQMWRPGAHSGLLCPACIGEVSSPIKLPCGHSWCRSCLQRYLKVATQRDTSFPLICHGVDKKCGVPIPLFVAKSMLSVSDYDAIVEAAFSTHIQTHPEEFHYCPTPDCQQIYRSAPEGISMQCPDCLIRICTNCHSDAHDGLTCSEVHDGDDLFMDWVSKNDVKQCPKCNMAIEKSEGCNHMTCSMCRTHICWVCLDTFKDGYAIYGHMQDKHGGSGI